MIGVGDVRAAAAACSIAQCIQKTADIDAVIKRFMAQGAPARARHQLMETNEPRQRATTCWHVYREKTLITLAKRRRPTGATRSPPMR